MLIAKHPDQALPCLLLQLLCLLLKSFRAILDVGCFDYGFSFDLLSGLAKHQGLELFALDLLVDSLVDHCRRTYPSLVRRVGITDLVNVLELLVEHVVHPEGVNFELVNLEDSVSKGDSVLKAR